MRDSDNRSSISRAMRSACASMMSRKRSRAAASSRAGPCSVSINPDSAASGVRNSWLALATKSARISSTRRSGVRSRKVSSNESPRARRPARATGMTIRLEPAVGRNALGEFDALRLAARRRTADRVDHFGHPQCDRCRFTAPQGRRDARAGGLNATTRPSRSSAMVGIGKPATNGVERSSPARPQRGYARRHRPVRLAPGSRTRPPSNGRKPEDAGAQSQPPMHGTTNTSTAIAATRHDAPAISRRESGRDRRVAVSASAIAPVGSMAFASRSCAARCRIVARQLRCIAPSAGPWPRDHAA